MNEQTDDGIVEIHGMKYETVALRVTKFREEHPEWTIKTKIVDAGLHVIVKATVIDPEGRVISTGHAEEERGEGMINQTSALENAETSACGRALAFYKFPGHFIRSADEMSDAAIQQSAKNVQRDFGHRMAVVREILPQLVDLKDRLADGDWYAAAEIVLGFNEREIEAINLAPTKGGILTTNEVALLKSDDYTGARRDLAAQQARQTKDEEAFNE